MVYMSNVLIDTDLFPHERKNKRNDEIRIIMWTFAARSVRA